MRILPGLALIVAMATGCGGAKKKSPQNPTNESHETAKDSDKDDDDVKDKDANEGDSDSSSPRSADPCEGGQ